MQFQKAPAGESAVGAANLRPSTLPSEPVWYFAYGSNMKSSSMAKRAVKPLDIKIVQAPFHYVTFDIFGIPYSEPSYASIEEFPHDETSIVQLEWRNRRFAVPRACGVAYLLAPDDFHRLLVTEGSGVVYNIIQIGANVVSPDNQGHGTHLVVHTLKAKRPLRPNGAPSARYMHLFREGAKEHQLPAHYTDYLESFPTLTKPVGRDESLGACIFTYFWRPLLKRVVRLTEVNVDQDGNCPKWVAVLIVFLYLLMWTYHDLVHRHIFGSGDGGKLYFRTVPKSLYYRK